MLSSPSVTGETQPTMRIVDDLPAPFGPRKPKASPRRTSTSMPSTAVKSPNRLVSPRARSRMSSPTGRTLVAARGQAPSVSGGLSRPCRRSSGTSIASHSANQTSRGGSPASSASCAVRPPSAAMCVEPASECA